MRLLALLAEACRVKHWIKNLLILFPAFFVNQIFSHEVLMRMLPALISFSLVASAVYLINDIRDVENDRRHPVKCNRPIASGAVSIRVAWVVAVFLVLTGIALTRFASSPKLAGVVLVMYLLANVGYSLGLKNKAIVDVFILASGFVFRIFYGGFYFSIPISSWLFLCVFSAALYFALGKRKNECKKYKSGGSTRPVLSAYSIGFLSAHYYLCCALTVIFYCLWTITRTDQASIGKLALSIPFMVFILFRYNLIVESADSDADPVPTFLHDKWLVFASAMFLLINFAILYFGEYMARITY